MGKLNRLLLVGAAAFASVSVPTATQAAVQVGPAATVSPCSNFSFNVTILQCAGGYSGNLLQDSLTDSTGKAALVALGAPGTGTYLEDKLESLSSTTGIINFNTMLTGLTVFGFHAGGAGDGKEGTFFFSFDAGSGVDIIQITDRLNSRETGLSNAALFKTGTGSAVPEPGTWAMMLLGFGATGFGMRRRSRSRARVTA